MAGFTARLEESINRCQNRALNTVEVIEELIGLAKEIGAPKPPNDMTEDEYAFYQALAENESAVRELGHPALRGWHTSWPTSCAAPPPSTGNGAVTRAPA